MYKHDGPNRNRMVEGELLDGALAERDAAQRHPYFDWYKARKHRLGVAVDVEPPGGWWPHLEESDVDDFALSPYQIFGALSRVYSELRERNLLDASVTPADFLAAFQKGAEEVSG